MESMQQCTRCGLAAIRTQVVVGSGSQTARVMFTGEAPGKEEDRTGRGFQGTAGKIFDDVLLYLGLTRGDIWLNNVVRCRPTDSGQKNRPPKVSELEACRPWMLDDIGRVRPQLIVTLGRMAFRSLTGETEFSTYRGHLYKPHDLGIPEMFPLAHPAYLIYRRSLMSQYRDDLDRLGEALDAFGIARNPSIPKRFI